MLAWTCKKTKPKPNPNSVIPKQQAAVVTISPIYLYFIKVFINQSLGFIYYVWAIVCFLRRTLFGKLDFTQALSQWHIRTFQFSFGFQMSFGFKLFPFVFPLDPNMLKWKPPEFPSTKSKLFLDSKKIGISYQEPRAWWSEER